MKVTSSRKTKLEMEKTWFRLSICLKNFFNDERARCYVGVEGSRPVRWLRRRLLHLFGAPLRGAGFALTCRGHLLPDDEPLSLVCHDDLIVYVLSHCHTLYITQVFYSFFFFFRAVPVQFQVPTHGNLFEECVCSIDDDLKSKTVNAENLNTKYSLENNVLSEITPHENEASLKQISDDSAEEKTETLAKEELETNDLRMKLTQKLQDYKQQALDLLDQCTVVEDNPMAGPKPKRRRVRKRRHPQDGSAQSEHYHYDCSQSIGNSEGTSSTRVVSDEPVYRNTSLEVRPARLVQPVESMGR